MTEIRTPGMGIRRLHWPPGPTGWFLPALLAVAVVWVFWAGRAGGFLLDDYGSLATLETVRMSPERFWDFVWEEDAGPLGRPLAIMLFTAEYAYANGDTQTLKTHSILLHATNFIVLFVLLRLMIRARAPGAENYWAALAAALLWAVTPQQTSTVLYTVQRMAMLSAFFAMLSLVAFLQARCFVRTNLARVLWSLLSACLLVCALLSKENAIVILPVFLLLEVLWIDPVDSAAARARQTRKGMALLLATLVAVPLFLWLSLDYFDEGYRVRQFDMAERLLSQPRAVLDYAVQFIAPDVSRMGVYHDDYQLGSAPVPRSDLALTVALCMLVALCAASMLTRKLTAVSFASAAFLVAHAPESSLLALEPYFEHRNYLPSIFIAVLVAAGLSTIFSRYSRVRAPLLLGLSLPLLALAMTTAAQALVWSNGLLLSVHHLQGHPGSSRANADMATRYAILGDYASARDFSVRANEAAREHKAARPERAGDMYLRNVALACLAGADMPALDLRLLGREDAERPLGDTHTMEVILQLLRSQRCPGFAWDDLSRRLREIYLDGDRPASASVAMLRTIATINYQLARLDDALDFAGVALGLQPENPWLHLLRLQVFVEQGRLEDARLTKEILLSLHRRGKLNRGQSETLRLYEAL